jgi:arylsulfate sulfotransferase
VAVGIQVRRMAVTITNPDASNSLNLSPSISGSSDFAIASDVSCGQTVAANGICSMIVLYTPSAAGNGKAQLDLGMSSNDQVIALTGNGVQLSAGQSIVAKTDNPLVALYTYAPQTGGDLSIEFGPDTNYGLQTWSKTATAGAPTSILVAGMKQNTTYHMRAKVAGTAETDADQTFQTGSFTADQLPTISVTSNGAHAGGIELMNPALGANNTFLEAFAIDLQGNLIWGYNYVDRQGDSLIQPIKQLPNGDFLMIIAPGSQTITTAPPASETIVIREINLAGVPVKQITMDQLNQALSSSSITLVDLHHDIEVLPNGHWLFLGNNFKNYDGLPGTTGTTQVLGDVVVDLDTNLKPVWTWNAFDHLDINRAPVGYPDWTHSNAILYSPDDGNILVSSRHQSWLMKIDYANGTGSGNVLWKLGYQGDFTLVNGTEPQDWFFGQHQPSFTSANTAGIFSLTLMDNGFDRHTSPTTACSGAACYSTVPIVQVDETAKTATITFRDDFGKSLFSFFGGGTTVLPNGNIEYDLCALGKNAQVGELTVGTGSATVWSATDTGQNLYRSNRISSLYPGVQW